eukprot:TRINITY_DN10246_c0_g1_i1.p1 TRINITY_DN10246_c0_g1~~TRINITY_DN10246_c0_g1_i1.p1  ORF type:complete len:806 (-),score=183.10 TRINITY_DN10246_c0_g1_i1:190-2361(-)
MTENGKLGLLSNDLSTIEPFLEGASKMFGSLFEGIAVNELGMAGDSLNALFGELLVAVDTGNAVEAEALTKDIAREVKLQEMYASSIADGISDQYRKQRVLGDYNQLAALCVGLPELTKQALEGAPGARIRLGGLVSEAQMLQEDLLVGATKTTEAELMEGGMRITQALQNLRPLMQFPHENREHITTGISELLNKIKSQTSIATSWAATVTNDPSLAERITGQAQQLRAAAAPLAVSVKKCLSTPPGPEFEKAKKEFLDATEKFVVANDQLVSAIVQSPDDELEGLQGKMGVNAKKLQEAMAIKDMKAVAAAICELKKDVKGMNYLATLMSGDLDDPDLQKSLLDMSSRLAGKLDGLLDASKSALKNAKKPDSMKEFNDILSDFESTVSKLVNVTDSASPEDQMSSNAVAIVKLEKKYAREIEQNNKQSNVTLTNLQKRVEKQKQLGQVVAKRCDFDPKLAEKVIHDTLQLDDLLLNVQNCAKEVKNKPGDKNALAELKKCDAKFCEHTTQTGSLAQNVKKAKKEAEERAKEEARIAEEKARLEEEEEKKKAAVAAAAAAQAVPVGIKEVWIDAQKLVTLISETKLLSNTTPVGNLMGIADKLARSMQDLAGLSRNGTKNEIISSARVIAGMVDEIFKFVNEVSLNCRDPILNREMKDMSHVAKNFSVQLKILCGVKAGLLLDEDKDTTQSLVICAKGLCRAVGDVCNRAQIANLKPIARKK